MRLGRVIFSIGVAHFRTEKLMLIAPVLLGVVRRQIGTMNQDFGVFVVSVKKLTLIVTPIFRSVAAIR